MSFTAEELRILKKLIDREMEKEEKATNHDKKSEEIAAYPKSVVVGVAYPSLLNSRFSVHSNGSVYTKYPAPNDGYLWLASSGEPIPSQTVANILNVYLFHYNKNK